MSNPRVFDAHCSEFVFAEKADGTCIQFWWSAPSTLDAVHQTMLRRANDARITQHEAGDEETAEPRERADFEEGEDAEAGQEDNMKLDEESQQPQGLGKASLIEKRARRFKKVLPRVLQPSATEGEADEPPKHVRGLVRKPQVYHVRPNLPPSTHVLPGSNLGGTRVGAFPLSGWLLLRPSSRSCSGASSLASAIKKRLMKGKRSTLAA